jgi:hypothetical protein
MKILARATTQAFTRFLGWRKEEHDVLVAKCCAEMDDWKTNHLWVDM